MNEYIRYYHEDRTHLALAKETPAGRVAVNNSEAGSKVVVMPRLGGLHHRYDRAAWVSGTNILLQSRKTTAGELRPPHNRSPHFGAFATISGHRTILTLSSNPHPRRSHRSKPSHFSARMEFWRGTATDASKPLAQREKTAMSWNCFHWLSVMPMTGTAAHPSGWGLWAPTHPRWDCGWMGHERSVVRRW
jgi:hypothetical protein